MYSIRELFEKRSMIGAKIEGFMEKSSYTKTRLCREADISRPTLNKILSGTLTNMTTFEKHMAKILDCLELTPDILLGNRSEEINRARTMRNLMKISTTEISEATDIPLWHLREIESGEAGTLAELRDIAICLGVGVSSLQYKNYFDTQVSTPDIYLSLRGESDHEDLSGFWGHVGIIPVNMKEELWYPISRQTYESIATIEKETAVIPCMNNRILLINMNNISELVFAEDSCDIPNVTAMGEKNNCQSTPLVIYEALEDLIIYDLDEISEEKLSPRFKKVLAEYIERKTWDEEDIISVLYKSVFYFKDGNCREAHLDFLEEYENISTKIFDVYNCDDTFPEKKWLRFFENDGVEKKVNFDNVAFIDAPLLEVNNAISRSFEL